MDIKKLFLSALYPLLTGIATGQKMPQIITLYPGSITVTEDLRSELQKYNMDIEITEEMRAEFVSPALPQHWQKNRTMMLEFMKEQDFFGLVTKSISDQLTYLLHNNHDAIINFPVREVCPPDLKTYRQFADKYQVAWIVNLTSLEMTKQADSVFLKVRIQLFNKPSNWIWLNKEYIAQSGGCKKDPIDCALSDLVDQCATEIFDMIEAKRHYWSM